MQSGVVARPAKVFHQREHDALFKQYNNNAYLDTDCFSVTVNFNSPSFIRAMIENYFDCHQLKIDVWERLARVDILCVAIQYKAHVNVCRCIAVSVCYRGRSQPISLSVVTICEFRRQIQ
jgi:hypothetical protein